MTRVVLVLALSTTTTASYAQTEDQRATARAAADQGAQAFEAGRFAEAIGSFERAESLVHAPPHLLFIARAQAKLGQLLRARATYRKIVRENLAPTAPPPFRTAQTEAKAEIAELANRIPRLKVLVNGVDESSLRVAIDGEKLPPSMLGVQMAIDPGDHFVTAASGSSRQSKTVFLAEGARENVVLDFGGTTSAARKSDGSSSGLQAGTIVAFGLGVIGVAGGTFLALESNKKHDDAEALCKNGCPVAKKDEIDGLYSDAKTLQTMSAVSFVVGGVGLVTGTTLLIVSGSSSSKEKNTGAVRPFVGVGNAGVRGRF